MLAIGARGAIHVRGEDSVHPEIVRHSSPGLNSFLARYERTAGTNGTRAKVRPGKELI